MRIKALTVALVGALCLTAGVADVDAQGNGDVIDFNFAGNVVGGFTPVDWGAAGTGAEAVGNGDFSEDKDGADLIDGVVFSKSGLSVTLRGFENGVRVFAYGDTNPVDGGAGVHDVGNVNAGDGDNIQLNESLRATYSQQVTLLSGYFFSFNHGVVDFDANEEFKVVVDGSTTHYFNFDTPGGANEGLVNLNLTGTTFEFFRITDTGGEHGDGEDFYVTALSASTDCPCVEVVDLIAGQHTDVGDVTITRDGDELCVKYETTGSWLICETHVHIGGSIWDIPQTRKGNPKIGRFDFNDSHDPGVSTFEICVDLDELGLANDNSLAIAVHAVVKNTCSYREETAWGEGCDFPGCSWAMFIKFVCP